MVTGAGLLLAWTKNEFMILFLLFELGDTKQTTH